MVTLGIQIVLLLLPLAGQVETGPLPLQVWAVEASREGNDPVRYDRHATEIKEALADLPFDTYVTVHHSTQTLQEQREARVRLTERYTLVLKFLSRETDRRARVAVTVELAPRDPDGAPANVVETSLLLAPDKKARIGGLRAEKGDLVLVLGIK